MITTEGKLHIKRYLAGYVPAIAKSMAFGIGTAAEALADTALQLEVDSSVINLTQYDFIANQLLYRASIPDQYAGEIREIGIYSLSENPSAADYASRLLTTFDSASESWETSAGAAAAFTTANTRVGADSLFFNPAANGTTTYYLNELELDLSGYSSADKFVFAYNVGNANTTQIQIRFWTDASNYFLTNLGAQTAGYKIVTVDKGAFTVTGTPNWSTITRMSVAITSGASGASDVSFDAVRINDIDTLAVNYILVARKVLATPVVKVAGMAQDIEFRLDFVI